MTTETQSHTENQNGESNIDVLKQKILDKRESDKKQKIADAAETAKEREDYERARNREENGETSEGSSSSERVSSSRSEESDGQGAEKRQENRKQGRRNGEEESQGNQGQDSSGDDLETRSFTFTKGDRHVEVPEDAEFEFRADKKFVRMTLREMRDAAAGGLAVRDRMRKVSEQKKALEEPFRQFSGLASKDPLAALQKMFGVVQTIDPDADFKSFIEGLGKQAQQIAKMGPDARKAYELERQVKDQEEQLTETEQLSRISELKVDLMENLGLSEETIYTLGEEILNSPALSEGVEDEVDLMNKVGQLAEEIELQKISYETLKGVKPDAKHNDPLVFELTKILRQNPDFDEDDLAEIAEDVVNSVKRTGAAQKLSNKQRGANRSGLAGRSRPPRNETPDYSRMSSVDALKDQIMKKKEQQKNNLASKRI
jgi:hypothetical protein